MVLYRRSIEHEDSTVVGSSRGSSPGHWGLYGLRGRSSLIHRSQGELSSLVSMPASLESELVAPNGRAFLWEMFRANPVTCGSDVSLGNFTAFCTALRVPSCSVAQDGLNGLHHRIL